MGGILGFMGLYEAVVLEIKSNLLATSKSHNMWFFFKIIYFIYVNVSVLVDGTYTFF